MNFEQMAGFILALFAMGLGTLGTLIPGLPGTPIVLAAAILHRLYFGAASVSNLALGILIVLALFSMLLDYVATMYGAKRMGATWRGLLGAFLGGIVGIFFSLPGLILGPFIGAILLELIGGRKSGEAFRAGTGTLLGLIAGTLGKIACCLAMIGIFSASVILRAGWVS